MCFGKNCIKHRFPSREMQFCKDAPLYMSCFKKKRSLSEYGSHVIYPFKVKNSKIFSIIEGCTSITIVNFRTFLLSPKETLDLWAITPNSTRLSSLVLGNHESIFCLYGFACSGHFILMNFIVRTCGLSLLISFTQHIFKGHWWYTSTFFLSSNRI